MGGFGSGRTTTRKNYAGKPKRGVVNWSFHAKQMLALKARRSEQHQMLLFGGAVRGGKTYFFGRDLVIAGLIDYPGDTFCVIRKELATLKNQLWKELRSAIRELVPEEYILKDAVSPRPEIQVLVQTPDGPKVTTYIGSDGKDWTRIMGYAIRGFYIDEGHEIAAEFFEVLPTRFSHSVGERDYHYIFIASNPAPGFLKTTFIENSGDPNCRFIPSTIFDNKFIDRQSAIDRITTGFGASEGNLRRYLYGAWDEFEGKAFKAWNEANHVYHMDIAEPEKCYHLQGFDHGYTNPSAILFACVSPDNKLYVYDEIYGPGLSPATIVSEYTKKCDKYGVPESQRLLICDNSIRRPERDGISIWGDLTERGMKLIMADKQKKGIYTIQGMLETSEMFVHERCKNLRREIPSQRFLPLSPARANIDHKPEELVDDNNHAFDALRYIVNYAVARRIKNHPKIDPDSVQSYVNDVQASRTSNGLVGVNAYNAMADEREVSFSGFYG